MIKSNLLTIGIPTYNRKKAILNCLDHLYEKKIYLKARILVIDNASEDQSYEIIHKKYSHVFDIHKNKKNIGFSGNTIELFKICSTEYLLWLSDEDIIIEKNIDKLIEILNKNSYFFLCPQYYLKNNITKLYRGNKKMKTVTYDLWKSASHLPGLIFNVPKSEKIINNFHIMKKKYPTAAKYNPQLFILSDLLIQDYKKCVYLDFPICSEKFTLNDTHDADPSGNCFGGTVSSKDFSGGGGLIVLWVLHKEFVEYLTDVKNHNNNPTIKNLLNYQRKRIYDVIRNSMERERPDILLDFNKASYKNIILLPFKLIYYFFTKPVILLRKIYKYLLI